MQDKTITVRVTVTTHEDDKEYRHEQSHTIAAEQYSKLDAEMLARALCTTSAIVLASQGIRPLQFPDVKEPLHKEKPRIGMVLRAFTERVFGVPVTGRLHRIDAENKRVRIDYGTYLEWRPYTYGFLYDSGPLAGQEFTFEDNTDEVPEG